jgi:hypothetical protein
MPIYKSYQYVDDELLSITVRIERPTRDKVELMKSAELPDEEALSAAADNWVAAKIEDAQL